MQRPNGGRAEEQDRQTENIHSDICIIDFEQKNNNI